MLRAIGHAFVWTFGHPARWLWHQVLAPFFGGAHRLLGAGAWIAAVALTLALGVLVGWLLIRRRSRIGPHGAIDELTDASESTADLERAAELAEAKGDNELAVRLRFRSGLALLETRGVIPDRLTMTSHQLRGILQSGIFDELASRHESIAYARQPASPQDAAEARDGWRRLLADARPTRNSTAVRETAGGLR